MLALSAQSGDVAIRTDLSKSFILQKEPANILANWQELLTPTDAVQSVAGKTGVVTLTKSDVGLDNVDNTNDSSKKVLSASKLTTPRTINGVSFDGSADITIKDDTKEPKIATGTSAQMWTGTKKWVSILSTVQSVLLTGLSTAKNSMILASDNIIEAFGKLQAQINARLQLSGGTMDGNINMGNNKITSSAIPSKDDEYVNKKYIDGLTISESTINDFNKENLLDSDGNPILGSVKIVETVPKIYEKIDSINTYEKSEIDTKLAENSQTDKTYADTKAATAQTNAESKAASLAQAAQAAAVEYANGELAKKADSDDVPTKLSQLSDDVGYAKKTDIASVYRAKGTVASLAELTALTPSAGDTYNVTAEIVSDKIDTGKALRGDNIAWNGTSWDNLSGFVDLTPYAKKTEVAADIAAAKQAAVDAAATDAQSRANQALSSANSYTDSQIDEITIPIMSESAYAAAVFTDGKAVIVLPDGVLEG